MAARAKFHVYRSNVSLLRGEKPIFGPLSKNNTGMAALRAGLPIKSYNTTTGFEHTTYAIKPEHLAMPTGQWRQSVISV